jgi:hypothetical protein
MPSISPGSHTHQGDVRAEGLCHRDGLAPPGGGAYDCIPRARYAPGEISQDEALVFDDDQSWG